MFNKLIYLIALTLFCCLSGQGAKAEKSDLVFICHKGMKYSEGEVKFAFKGYLDEPRPIDNTPLKEDMLKYIGYTKADGSADESKYNKVWGKMFFRRALFVPQKVHTDEEVVNWVAHVDGGIGYVRSTPSNPNVEVCGSK